MRKWIPGATILALAVMMLLAWPAAARAKDAKSASVEAETPALNVTEQIALQAVAQEYSQLQQKFAAIQADFAKAHPGWHINAQTMRVEKDNPPTVENSGK